MKKSGMPAFALLTSHPIGFLAWPVKFDTGVRSAWRDERSKLLSYEDDPGYTNRTDHAWYPDNSGGTTHPVGEKLPNPGGLYHMYLIVRD